ncbi:hypothetical protein [Microcoleus sp. Pol12B4]|uniref:hypothetical protein n=1 Tax=Microcoleus sp. Pol12B4 TaxID=3055395 RepID=UPI002FD0BD96
MTFIVVDKHMNLPKSIAITCSPLIALALCGNGLCAIALETQPGNSGQKFGDFVANKLIATIRKNMIFMNSNNMTFMRSINELYELTFSAGLIMLTVLSFYFLTLRPLQLHHSFIQKQPSTILLIQENTK